MKKFSVLVDFDTPLIAAAASQQKNSVIATFNKNGKQKEFENKSSFNAWLKDNPKWAIEDFTIETKSVVVGSVKQALNGLINKIEYIKNSPFIADAKMVVGGPHGNFRDSVATIQPYKGTRGEKPILSKKLKEALLDCFDVDVIQPDTNIESDDVLSIYLYEDVDDKWSKRAIMSPDKDLKQCQGWHFDANNPHLRPQYISEFEGFYSLCKQGLTGDKTDNIRGLGFKHPEVIKKYGLTQQKGIGDVAATTILEGCSEPYQLAEKLVDVYKLSYEEGWKDILNENMQLLKMLDYKGQVYKFTEVWGID